MDAEVLWQGAAGRATLANVDIVYGVSCMRKRKGPFCSPLSLSGGGSVPQDTRRLANDQG